MFQQSKTVAYFVSRTRLIQRLASILLSDRPGFCPFVHLHGVAPFLTVTIIVGCTLVGLSPSLLLARPFLRQAFVAILVVTTISAAAYCPCCYRLLLPFVVRCKPSSSSITTSLRISLSQQSLFISKHPRWRL